MQHTFESRLAPSREEKPEPTKDTWADILGPEPQKNPVVENTTTAKLPGEKETDSSPMADLPDLPSTFGLQARANEQMAQLKDDEDAAAIRKAVNAFNESKLDPTKKPEISSGAQATDHRMTDEEAKRVARDMQARFAKHRSVRPPSEDVIGSSDYKNASAEIDRSFDQTFGERHLPN